MKIPTYRAASDRRSRGVDSYLDHFISEFQPVPPEAEDFREALQNVIDEAEWRVLMEQRRRWREWRFNFFIKGMLMIALMMVAFYHINQLLTAYQNTVK